jgi:hypothetical protein
MISKGAFKRRAAGMPPLRVMALEKRHSGFSLVPRPDFAYLTS